MPTVLTSFSRYGTKALYKLGIMTSVTIYCGNNMLARAWQSLQCMPSHDDYGISVVRYNSPDVKSIP